MSRVVLSTRGEASVIQIRLAQALYSSMVDVDPPTSYRLHSLLAGLPAGYLIVPRMVSIAEDYSRSLLFEASEQLLDLGQPMLADLWQRAERDSDSSWNGIMASWLKWHDLKFSDAPSHQRFMGFVEARNTIMHGLGELTRRQQRNRTKTVSKLSNAGLILSDRKILISQEDINRAAAASIELVEWLDLRAQEIDLH